MIARRANGVPLPRCMLPSHITWGSLSPSRVSCCCALIISDCSRLGHLMMRSGEQMTGFTWWCNLQLQWDGMEVGRTELHFCFLFSFTFYDTVINLWSAFLLFIHYWRTCHPVHQFYAGTTSGFSPQCGWKSSWSCLAWCNFRSWIHYYPVIAEFS